MQSKFSLGTLVTTPNAHRVLHQEDVLVGIGRHAYGDWGDICEEDKAINEQSLKQGSRLMSTFTDRNGTKFWIITEHDRSVTTVLLPEEY